MMAAKLYISQHMEKFCGPIACLPDDVRSCFTGYTSNSASKTQRFYFVVFCARNHIPIELCLSYMKVFGLNRSHFEITTSRRIYEETMHGDHLDYYSYVCGRNSCVDFTTGECIEARYICGKMSSYRLYDLQRQNTAEARHSVARVTNSQFSFIA